MGRWHSLKSCHGDLICPGDVSWHAMYSMHRGRPWQLLDSEQELSPRVKLYYNEKSGTPLWRTFVKCIKSVVCCVLEPLISINRSCRGICFWDSALSLVYFLFYWVARTLLLWFLRKSVLNLFFKNVHISAHLWSFVEIIDDLELSSSYKSIEILILKLHERGKSQNPCFWVICKKM